MPIAGWYASYNHDKTLIRKQRTRGAYKVSKDLVKYALAKVKAKPDIFISDLMLEVKEKFSDIDLSRQHLGTFVSSTVNSDIFLPKSTRV